MKNTAGHADEGLNIHPAFVLFGLILAILFVLATWGWMGAKLLEPMPPFSF